MNKKLGKMAFVMALMALVTGCQSVKSMFAAEKEAEEPSAKGAAAQQAAPVFGPETFNAKTVSLASQLASYMQNYDMAIHTVVVTTFVDLDRLKPESRFGRQLSEQMVYTLHTMGYRVFELRLAKELYMIENGGELMLSRKADEMIAPYRPDAVVVGTYQQVGSVVAAQARIIDAASARIVSVGAAEFRTDDDPYTAALLRRDEESAMGGDTPQSVMEIREMMAEGQDEAPKTLALKIDRLTRQIARTMTHGKPGQTVAVASFVDLDRLNQTNSFGRLLTETVMDRMARRGFAVTELRAARDVMIQPNVGEQLLTREPDELRGGRDADGVVLGTYTMKGNAVFVTARLVLPESRRVVAVGSFQMDVPAGDPFMKQLFENAVERVGENNFQGVRQ